MPPHRFLVSALKPSMSNPIPSIALLIGCREELKKILCDRFDFPEMQVTLANSLNETRLRFESTRFEFVAINRDLLDGKNIETNEILAQLTAQTPILMILDDDQSLRDNAIVHEAPVILDPDRALNDPDPATMDSMQRAQYIPMIEHASCNVLQQINLLINQIEIATRGNEAVGRSLDQIETANQELRNHLHVLRGISEPINLNLERHRVDNLMNDICDELIDEGRFRFSVESNLVSQLELFLDYERIKSAVRSVFNIFNSVVEPDSIVHLSDEMKSIEDVSFLRIKFDAATTVWDWKPSFELALCRRVFAMHGGIVEFEKHDQETITCGFCLPALVPAKL